MFSLTHLLHFNRTSGNPGIPPWLLLLAVEKVILPGMLDDIAELYVRDVPLLCIRRHEPRYILRK